jgi:hypothetical protein
MIGSYNFETREQKLFETPFLNPHCVLPRFNLETHLKKHFRLNNDLLNIFSKNVLR